MRTYRVYVHRNNDAISEKDLVSQYHCDRMGNFRIKDQFVSNYDVRKGDFITLSEENDEFMYKVLLIIVQSTQIALIAEELKMQSSKLDAA